MGKVEKMRIGIFYLDGVEIEEAAKELISFFRKRNVEILANEELKKAKHGEDMIIVSLGGDGTFLKASHIGIEIDVPVIGVNLGNLGFLTDVEARDLFDAAEELLKGHFFIDKRSILKCTVVSESSEEKSFYAVNDFILMRYLNSKLLHSEVFIDGVGAGKFRSDGLIVATPTGSTAYALSLNGPIITPLSPVYELVFIAPHKLSARPVVFSDKNTLSLRILSKDPVSFQRDGEELLRLKMFDRLIFKNAEKQLSVAHLKKKNFFDVLNKKFGWGK